MIENLAVGPPAQGFPGVTPREAPRGSPREDQSGSFSKTLEAKTSQQSPTREEPRARSSQSDPPKAQLRENPGKQRATTARENAIQKFMDSFESEFGIPPQKMVEAMALLEPEELTLPPEDTAALVVEKLGLSEEEEARAQSMYAGLLAELQKIEAAPNPMRDFAPQGQQVTAAFMEERWHTNQVRRDAMNQSIDRLNQNFWKTPEPRLNQEASAPTLVAQPLRPEAEIFSIDQLQMMESPEWQSLPLEERAALLSSQLEVEGGEAVPQEQSAATPLRESTAAGQGPDLKRLMEEMSRAVDEAPPTQAKAIEGETEASPKMMGAWALAGADSTAGEEASSFGQSSQDQEMAQQEPQRPEKSLKSAPTSVMPLRLEDVAAALKSGPPVPGVVSGGLVANAPNSADTDSNVRQILSQAQYLIKKGGGEVNVEMTPEGMGKVQMKVLLQDGKVNVQMATESHEAKKMIESSLSELRSSLAAQKLSMDHVKVDVVTGPNTSQTAQNDFNMNQDSPRDTQQFWNRFQDQFGNRGQKDGFWDIPALKGYRQFKAPPVLEPLEPTAAPQRREASKGNGLNLVA